jgi:RHS repeat-associated protein
VDNGSTTYTYDAEGQRVGKTTAGALTGFIYDREGQVILTNPANPTMIEMNVAGLHLGTYILNSAQTDTVFYYDHSDWLGTERARTNLSGTACETITSLPFGDGQTINTTCGDLSPKHFTGKERDTESGLDMFGARYYGSSLGRFMTPDWAAKPTDVPYANFGNPQSLNLYSYVQNNPTTMGDPDGHVDPVTGIDIAVEIATYIAAHPEEVQAVEAEAAAGAGASRWGFLAGPALYLGEMIDPHTTVGGDKTQAQLEQEKQQNQEKQAEPELKADAASGGARKGGGRNEQKSNVERAGSATKNLADAKADLAAAKAQPPSKQRSEAIKKAQQQIKHWQNKAAEKSETHSRKHKGQQQ